MVGILKKWNFGLWRFTVPVAMVLALGFTLLPMATPVQAATFTAAATGNWNVGATWGNTGNNVEGSGYPGPSDTANIPIGYPLTVTIPAGVTARATTVTLNSGSADGTANLTLADATSSLIVSGNITMNAPGTTNGNRGCTLTTNGGTVTIGGNLSMSSYFKSGGSKVFQSKVDFTGGGTVSVAGTITLTSNSASAPSLIDMTGGGTLQLTASSPSITITNSTFTPGTGTVEYSGTTQTVSTAITYNNLSTSNSGTKTLANNTTVGAALTVGAGTTLDLSTFTLGTPTSLTLYTGATTASSITGSGALTLGGNVTVTDAATGSNGASVSCPVALGATRTFTVADDGTSATDLTLSGVISATGAYGPTKAGAGTMVLSGNNTYTGLTTISAGILKLGAAGGGTNTPLGTTAAGTTVSATGAALDLGGYTLGTAEVLTLNGTGVSSGGALMNSSGSAVNYSGAITLASASSIGTTGNITLGGGITGIQNLTKVGNAILNLGSNTATLNSLTISAGTLTSTSGTMSLAGDFSNSGAFTHNSGTVTLNGSSAQAMTGAATFYNLTLNNSNGLTINNDVTVSGTLTFTSGNITTNSNKVIIASGGSVSHTSGHVVGNLQKAINTNGSVSRTFEVGTGSDYTPIDVTISGVSGSGASGQTLTGSSTSGEHSNISTSFINSTKNVNRYWALTYGGTWTFTSYDAKFTFVDGDKDVSANTSYFVVRKFTSGTWFAPLTNSPTANDTTGKGFTSFSDFIVGEPAWQSYREEGHTNVWGTATFPYDATFSTAYNYGDGYIAGHSYAIGFFDGQGTNGDQGTKIVTNISGSLPGTTLSALYALSTHPEAIAGTWHAVVFDTALGSPPSAYSDCSGSAGYINEDDFEVGVNAIPEFPTVFASIGVMGLCAGIYYRMRKKAKIKRQTAC